jgi:hypothetical protein
MILIDTSAWVDYLRGVDGAATAAVRQLITHRHDELVMCEPIAMELLAGAQDGAAVERLERLTEGLPSLAFEAALDFRSAAALHRFARADGETVRSIVDCLIAAVALRHDVTLVHKDRDFEVLARVTPLRQHSYRAAV